MAKHERKLMQSEDGEMMSVMHKRIHARFEVPINEIPEAKKWEVGKVYTIQAKVRQVSVREPLDKEENKVEFEIQSLKAV